jgi:HSP20 family molecular chaperone IbpA
MQYKSTQNGETIPNSEQCCAPTNSAHACSPRVNQAPTTSQGDVTHPSASAKQAQSSSFAATPRYRATTSDDTVSLRVELPGVGQDALTLTVEDGVLTLDAKQSLSPAGSEVLRQALEFRLTDFRGRWRLPENVDADAITSTLRHGVLEVALPLKKPARRTIAIA